MHLDECMHCSHACAHARTHADAQTRHECTNRHTLAYHKTHADMHANARRKRTRDAVRRGRLMPLRLWPRCTPFAPPAQQRCRRSTTALATQCLATLQCAHLSMLSCWWRAITFSYQRSRGASWWRHQVRACTASERAMHAWCMAAFSWRLRRNVTDACIRTHADLLLPVCLPRRAAAG